MEGICEHTISANKLLVQQWVAAVMVVGARTLSVQPTYNIQFLHQLMEIPKLHNFILYYIVYPENFMPLYWSFSEQKIDQMPVKLDNIT